MATSHTYKEPSPQSIRRQGRNVDHLDLFLIWTTPLRLTTQISKIQLVLSSIVAAGAPLSFIAIIQEMNHFVCLKLAAIAPESDMHEQGQFVPGQSATQVHHFTPMIGQIQSSCSTFLYSPNVSATISCLRLTNSIDMSCSTRTKYRCRREPGLNVKASK